MVRGIWVLITLVAGHCILLNFLLISLNHDFVNSSDVKSKWLDAYHDPVASLYTFTQCITLSDIQADGDWKLIIADLGTGSFNMKLKVYKGKSITQTCQCNMQVFLKAEQMLILDEKL